MAKKNEVAVVPSGFLPQADTDLGDLIREELDGLSISFGKVKIPSGGGLNYELPGEDGEPDSVKEFSAVILLQHPLNAYYATEYKGGNQPPDCAAIDGRHGVKRATGELPAKAGWDKTSTGGFVTRVCADCPYNQFDSGKNGGKACQNRRRIYILREGELFPMLLSLPTGSLQEFTRYLTSLVTKGRKSNSVVTRFALQKATNKGGIEFSRAKFGVDRALTPEEYAHIQRLTEQVRELSASVGFDEDVNEGECEFTQQFTCVNEDERSSSSNSRPSDETPLSDIPALA